VEDTLRCKKIQKWLVKEPQVLSNWKKNQINLHLKTCKKCRFISQKLSDLANELRSAKEESVPSEITEKIWQEVRTRIKDEPKSEKIRRIRSERHPSIAWGIPSFALVCLLLIFLMLKPWTFWSPENDFNPSSIDVAIESAEIDGKNAQISIFEMSDPDMTFIWLEKTEVQNGG